jgi:hypothetical protein
MTSVVFLHLHVRVVVHTRPAATFATNRALEPRHAGAYAVVAHFLQFLTIDFCNFTMFLASKFLQLGFNFLLV